MLFVVTFACILLVDGRRWTRNFEDDRGDDFEFEGEGIGRDIAIINPKDKDLTYNAAFLPSMSQQNFPFVLSSSVSAFVKPVTTTHSPQPIIRRANKDGGYVLEETDLCQALKCSKGTYCYVKNEYVAFCAPKNVKFEQKSSIKEEVRPKIFKAHLTSPKQTTKKPPNLDDYGDLSFEETRWDESADDGDKSSSESKELVIEDKFVKKKQSVNRHISVCTTCSVTAKPSFVCASDNRTYSTPCRMKFHNCLNGGSKIWIMCVGFCPCTGVVNTSLTHNFESNKSVSTKNVRWGSFVNKYKLTTGDDLPHKLTATKVKGDQSTKQPSNLLFANWSPATLHLEQDKPRQKGHNSVLVEKAKISKGGYHYKDCSPNELNMVGKNLLDSFSYLMTQSKRNKFAKDDSDRNLASFPSRCKPDVRRMFLRLDKNADALLSTKELNQLNWNSNSRERCLEPFLARCNLRRRDDFLAAHEWCLCFDRTQVGKTRHLFSKQKVNVAINEDNGASEESDLESDSDDDTSMEGSGNNS